MRLGLPRDFDELVRFHGALISAVSGAQDMLLVAHHLWYRGILETFKPPREISRDQVLDYLGITSKAWHLKARTQPLALPKPLSGALQQHQSRYYFSDAERCYAQRDELFPYVRRLGFYVSVVPGFAEFLSAEAKKIAEEIQLGYIFDVPPDLPQTQDEIMAEYEGTIVRVVRFHLKYGIDVEDAIHEVWTKLFKSNLLVKFMRSGASRLPAQLTTEEVLDYLGVEWSAWRRMLATYEKAPNPVKGACESMEAIYHSEDITALDNSGYFKKRGLRYLPAASVSKDVFDKYVAKAATHALLNVFRTLDRRANREATLPEGACINDSGRVAVLRRDEVDFTWVDTLSASTSTPLSGAGIDSIAVDTLVDIKRRAALVEQQTTA